LEYLSGGNLGSAHINRDVAGPDGVAARDRRGADGDVGVRRLDGVVAFVDGMDPAKFAEVGLRSVENVLEIPAVVVGLVLALRRRRNGDESKAKHRKKPGKLDAHEPKPLT